MGWRKQKLESRLPEEISITSDMQIPPPLWQKVSSCQEVGTTWFFSSGGGILELRRGSQPSPWVGPGKPNLPLGFIALKNKTTKQIPSF